MADSKGLILILTNNIGGLHSFRKEVVKSICDEGYDVAISFPDDDDRQEYFADIGCKLIKTEFNRRGMNPIADMKLMLAYVKLIRREKPVAVLSYTIKPNVYGGMACRLTHTPQLANVTGLGDAMENGGWLQRMTVMLYKIGIGKAKTVFFQNMNNREQCIRLGITNESAVQLPGSGVNLIHHMMQSFPANDMMVKFLFIGRMLRDKGIEEYFEAAKSIKEKYPNAEFQILGAIEGDYQQRLDELITAGIIKHLGTTSDVRPFIGAVHCTVMPSYHEGMSNVNLESAANGRPVITTNVPGCQETVDDGISGYLVNPHDANMLGEAMARFIELPYTQKVEMGKNGRKKVEREFDRQIVIDKYLAAIRVVSK